MLEGGKGRLDGGAAVVAFEAIFFEGAGVAHAGFGGCGVGGDEGHGADAAGGVGAGWGGGARYGGGWEVVFHGEELLEGEGVNGRVDAGFADQEVVVDYGDVVFGELDIWGVLVRVARYEVYGTYQTRRMRHLFKHRAVSI